MLLLRRYPEFRRLFTANVVSMLGDWLTYVAVGVLAIGTPGGPGGLGDVAAVLVAHTVPQVIGAPLAGWLADRFDRKRLIVLASVVRGLLTLAMAVAAFRQALGWVEVLLFLRMAGAAFVTTPSSALVPRLVAKEDVVEANALLGLSWGLVFTAGVVLGGFVSAFVGPVVALAADAITFAVAAFLVARLEVPPARVETRRVEGSLSADARANPHRLLAALIKTPTQFVNGAAFVGIHGLAVLLVPGRAALALGGLHALRGVSNGLAPWFLRRRISAERMAGLGALLAISGAGVLAIARGASEGAAPLYAIVGALLWGGGVGATWTSGGAILQRVVPDSLLGRYTALDLTFATLASAIGGVGYAMIAATIALFVMTSSAAAQPAWLDEALDARGLTDDDFARTEVYSWTTGEQAALLASERRLLRASASDGRSRSPYQRALDTLAVSRTDDPDEVALAGLLSSDPRLAARRYAWTTPYGTVLPRGQRSYGDVLVRIELDPNAWFARFAPDEHPAFRVVDASGNAVPMSDVLTTPSRLSSVVHVRAHDRPTAFREIIVHGGVRRWSIGTPAIVTRIEEERRILAALRRIVREGPFWTPHALVRAWGARGEAERGIGTRFAQSMPFDTPRHRMTDAALAGLEAAMSRRARLGALALDVESPSP